MARDIHDLEATELAALYRSRELSPVDVTEALLARADELDPAVGAFFTRTPEIARAEAEASEKRFAAGQPLGALDGVPYSIKDLEPTAGIRTTFANPATADWVPDFDTLTVSRLRSSGGVLLGKTSAPDMGYKDSPENLLFPATGNPWNLARNPGGSSSGAAASVAAGFSPVAQGSDGAGSIRIPSSLCGVVGFKASFGRVPVAPQAFPWGSTVHNGPIARSVRDAALLLDVIAGPDPRDPTSLFELPAGGFASNLSAPAPARIAVSADLGYGATERDVADSVRSSAHLLSGLGHIVEDRDPGWASPADALATMWTTAFAARYGSMLAEHPEYFEPALTEIIRVGLGKSAMDIWAYQAARGALYDSVTAFFADTDYLITPTMPLTAWPLLSYPDVIDGIQMEGRRSYLCNVYNLTGHPAITIPCGLSADGMPIGLQIVGRLHDDVGVLRIAQQLEAAIGFSHIPSLTDRG
jgi:Asp-tRNA(Asn)/Glu-tRNA(Gln) amidotransferase A subunit family amidase